MTTGFTIVAGARQADGTLPRGAHIALTLRLIDHARALGLRTTLETSRTKASPSRYVEMIDRLDHRWIVRISNHRHCARTGRDQPHLDFVSFDGVSGEDKLHDFIAKIASGALVWFETDRSPRMKQQRGRR